MRLVKIVDRYINPETVSGVVPAGIDAEVRLASGERFTTFGMTVEDVRSAFKRGPTPCASCRWFASIHGRSDGLCNANGASQFWESSKDHLGCWVSADAQAIGCPKHEEA